MEGSLSDVRRVALAKYLTVPILTVAGSPLPLSAMTHKWSTSPRSEARNNLEDSLPEQGWLIGLYIIQRLPTSLREVTLLLKSFPYKDIPSYDYFD